MGDKFQPAVTRSADGAGEFLFYQTEDGQTRVQVRLHEGTVWMSQKMLADLYQTTVANINQHLAGIYDDEELSPEATVKQLLIVQTEGIRQVRRTVDHYSLPAILAVGYRVRSTHSTQFRRWATATLDEYLIKGFVLDDRRLKAGTSPSSGYFEDLLARIRDIRASEKIFWRKVLDIYSTSVDYDPRAEASQAFFAKVQNKMHWAAHGHTAAEIVHDRANAAEPHMGLTAWENTRPQKSDIEVAKNYLTHGELNALNRIVTAYLEFAEVQALDRQPMYMQDWITKLDEFLKLGGRQLLSHAGRISHEQALAKAQAEYEQYRTAHLNDPWPAEEHFLEATRDLQKRLQATKPKPSRR